MSKVRRNQIFDMLKISGRVTITELASEFGVSTETTRRDLKKMAEEGVVELVRGGAALPDVLREAAFQHCLNLNAELKRRIAETTARLVTNGDTIMIGGGSTTSYFALALREHRNLRIITNSVDAARILGSRGENEVIVVGGKLDIELGATTGIVAVENIHRYSAQMVFFSVGAVDARNGLTCDTADEASCWSTMIENSEQAVALVDSSKFGNRCLFRCASYAEIDCLVSDSEPDAAIREAMKRDGVRFLKYGDAPEKLLPDIAPVQAIGA